MICKRRSVNDDFSNPHLLIMNKSNLNKLKYLDKFD